eukprot:gene7889-8530_t
MEAQNILIKTKIAPVKEPSRGEMDYDEREPLVSAPRDNQNNVSPVLSELSSSFLSSNSSITMESDEEVQSTNRPKKKERKDFGPSPSINIRKVEEGLNEKLIELTLSKELDQPLVNEAIDDLGSESDGSFDSIL